MVFHMKTTLNIPDSLYRALKRRAAERKETVSALVAEYLRRGLKGPGKVAEPPPLPSFSAGEQLIDVNDRERLYEVLDRERDERLYGRRRGE